MICDADGPTSLAGIMGGARSEVGAGTTRVLLEAASWDGANVQRTARRARAAQRGLRALREGPLAPARRSRRRRSRPRCSSSSAARACCRGPIDVGGPGETPPPIALRPARVAELLGRRDRAARAAARSCCRSASASIRCRRRRRALRVAVPHFRRGDVTREVDLIEEVARIDGLDRLPATLPPRRGVVRAADATPSACAGAPRTRSPARGLSEIAGWSFADPALLDRLRLPADDPMRQVVSAREPAVGVAVDHAPDAARLAARRRGAQRGARRRRSRAVRVGDRLPGRRPRAARRRAPRPGRAARRRARAARAGAASPRSAPTSSPPRACSAPCSTRSASSGASPPRRWPFLHPGRAASVLAGERADRLRRRAAPAGRGQLGSRARRDVGARPRRSSRALAPEVVAYVPFAAFPPRARGPRGRRRRRRQRRPR